MPLPPALVAKLQKRGIIKQTKPSEEVYAEAYDEKRAIETEDDSRQRGGAPGCPNKWNQYHLCSDFCWDYWNEGNPESRLGQKYQNDRRMMLLKYPLPANWQEIYDPGMSRHYYWNCISDEVSWLPPHHPYSVIGQSAQSLAREFFESKKPIAEQDESAKNRRPRNERRREDYKPRRKDENSLVATEETDPMEMSDRDRLKRAVKRKVDPMDPSSYADVPEGKWGDGLTSEAKTGVDTTASGPLFQSRPYPKPSAVLRKNNPEK